MNQELSYDYNVGDLIQVVLKNGSYFEAIVVKKYNQRKYDDLGPAFYARIVNRHRAFITGSTQLKNWTRYGIEDHTGVFVETSDCSVITILRRGVKTYDKIVSVTTDAYNLRTCIIQTPVPELGYVYIGLVSQGKDNVYATWSLLTNSSQDIHNRTADYVLRKSLSKFFDNPSYSTSGLLNVVR